MSKQNRAIKANEANPYCEDKSYRKLKYSDLKTGFYCNLFAEKCLHFEAALTQNFRGEELLYFPELALALRDFPHYPLVVREYGINEEELGMGMQLLQNLADLVSTKGAQFEADHQSITAKIAELVEQHGKNRQCPIVDELINDGLEVDWWNRKGLSILGVTWKFEACDRACDPIRTLSWYKFLNLSPYDVLKIKFEDAKLGTPFVALRIIRKAGSKGRVEWYSLETKQKVCAAEMKIWCRQNDVVYLM